MAHYFITSTGTEIGKTIVTAALTWQAKEQGMPYRAIKPILSGLEEGSVEDTDTYNIAAAQGLELDDDTWDALTPMRYQAPLAPSMAAKLEGRELSFDDLISFCKKEMANHDNLLIEGVGGSFVPLNDDYLVSDWIAALELESILVVGSYLGTISHTIATVEAMKGRGLKVKAIIMSESEGDNPDALETQKSIEQLTGISCTFLPRLEGELPLWKVAPDLLDVLDCSPFPK